MEGARGEERDGGRRCGGGERGKEEMGGEDVVEERGGNRGNGERVDLSMG